MATLPAPAEVGDDLLEQARQDPKLFARMMEEVFGLRETWTMSTEELMADETRLVSGSDKLHNVRTVITDYRQDGEAIWKRFSGGRDGTLWYYRALSDEFRRRKPNRITRELAIALQELEKAVVVKPLHAPRKGRSRRVEG